MPVANLTPVIERIAEVLADRLETLTIAGTEQTTVSEVVRPTRLGTWTPQDNQIVLTIGQTVRVPELDCPGNPPAECVDTMYLINCHVLPSERDDTSKAAFINRFVADVRKAVCNPTSQWHTFGQLAFDARFGDWESINDTSFDGAQIPLTIRYRTDEGNLYSIRA